MVTSSALFSSLILLPSLLHATTEWWGDLRAHMNPPRAPAFYDVTYDDSDCPSGLRADAIPDYVYFGTMIATFTVEEHDECLKKCLEKSKCKSVNFFFPLAFQEKGFCELLSETQQDNPRLMRPFRRAIHYEKIRCREEDGLVDFDSVAADETGAAVASAGAAGSTTTHKPSHVAEKKVVGIPRPVNQKAEINALMKKLAAKVNEFNHKQFSSFRA